MGRWVRPGKLRGRRLVGTLASPRARRLDVRGLVAGEGGTEARRLRPRGARSAPLAPRARAGVLEAGHCGANAGFAFGIPGASAGADPEGPRGAARRLCLPRPQRSGNSAERVCGPERRGECGFPEVPGD